MRHFPLTHKLKSLVGIQEPTIINNSKGHPVLVILPLYEEVEDGSWPTDRTHELQSLAQNWMQELQEKFNSGNPLPQRDRILNEPTTNSPSAELTTPGSPTEILESDISNPQIPDPQISERNTSSDQPSSSQDPTRSKIDPGMVEVSIALAGIATGVAAILSNVPFIGSYGNDPIDYSNIFLDLSQISKLLSSDFRIIIALLSMSLAVISSVSALVFLIQYRDKGLSLLWDWKDPYWFLALSLIVGIVLSVCVGRLALGT